MSNEEIEKNNKDFSWGLLAAHLLLIATALSIVMQFTPPQSNPKVLEQEYGWPVISVTAFMAVFEFIESAEFRKVMEPDSMHTSGT